jgi:chromosome segregation ATPase
MRDNDDFDNIPSMVPSRDDVNSRQQARQQPDLVKPVSYAELVKVSTWPVRIMLALLTVSLSGAAYYGYDLHQQTLLQLEQSNSRISDLEGRLALVGDSAEETMGNIIERVDFNFSEIDKLWAARNATNTGVTDLTGRVATVENRSQENLTAIEETNVRLVQSTNLVEDTRRDVATLRTGAEQLTTQLATLTTQLQGLRTVGQDLANLRAEISTAETTSGGLSDRLIRVEEAVEAIDTFRMQMNQTVLRLQQQIEAANTSNSN